MAALLKYFLRGLLIVVPVGVTGYVVFALFEAIDGWMPDGWAISRIPGVGFLVTFTAVVLVGWLGSNLITRNLVRVVDEGLSRVPFIKLVYTSIRDLVSAFVGEKKRFDEPVAIRLSETSAVLVLGFVTRKDLGFLGLPGHVAVYLPQSYNFAGNLLLVPGTAIQPLTADPGALMTFLVSGGVSGDKTG